MFECQRAIIAGKHRSAVQAQTDFYLLSNKITDSGYNTVSLLVLQKPTSQSKIGFLNTLNVPASHETFAALLSEKHFTKKGFTFCCHKQESLRNQVWKYHYSGALVTRFKR